MATSTTVTDPALQLDERELRAWRGMLRAHAALTKALDAELEAEHGIQLSTYEVFLYLDNMPDGRMRMSDLADSVLLSRSGLTRLVDRLEREGFVTRESCPSDARGSFARLTDLGRGKLAAARVTHLTGVRSRFVERLSPEELDVLGTIWERVNPSGATPEAPHCG